MKENRRKKIDKRKLDGRKGSEGRDILDFDDEEKFNLRKREYRRNGKRIRGYENS